MGWPGSSFHLGLSNAGITLAHYCQAHTSQGPTASPASARELWDIAACKSTVALQRLRHALLMMLVSLDVPLAPLSSFDHTAATFTALAIHEWPDQLVSRCEFSV